MNPQYENLVTGRESSIFREDLANFDNDLKSQISGSRIAVVGAAGSIGAAVAKTLIRFKPGALSFFDLSENNLVELIRDIRSSCDLPNDLNLEASPIGIGSVEFGRYFKENPQFDFFFNLAAMKHVRSEKNVYSLIRMIDTNVLFLYEFLENLGYNFEKVFSVSSDKAANPANLMGATKMAMEQVLMRNSKENHFSTARFANVAFSDGSLPYGFLRRMEKRQPLSAPNDVRRYFISHQEAGELCVLSAILGKNRDVFFPKLAASKDEKTFSWIAEQLLESLGFEPFLCSSEDEAKARVDELIPRKQWPCYFFKSDTTGEKDFEEFHLDSENIDLERFNNIGVVKRSGLGEVRELDAFIDFFRKAKFDPNCEKAEYVSQLKQIVPTLEHEEKNKNLDQKM